MLNFHVIYPPEASAGPSSTDIYGLNNYGSSFEGNIIIHGDDMYLVSITNQADYDKFVLKSNEKEYCDRLAKWMEAKNKDQR